MHADDHIKLIQIQLLKLLQDKDAYRVSFRNKILPFKIAWKYPKTVCTKKISFF